MIKVLLPNCSEITSLTLPMLEKRLGIYWFKRLDFQTDGVLSKVLSRSRKVLQKKELGLRERWLGAYFDKEITEPSIPPISIRWIGNGLGYGVFAEKDFPKGAFIGEYTGLVRKRTRKDKKNDYCFEYSIGDWPGNPYIIDAKDQGNFTRFINHHNDPNLEPLSIHVDGVMHIILVTLKAISKGEEIAYDYGELFWQKRTPPIR